MDTMILGNGFLRGFYTTHDLSTNKFGFAAHATSSKADPRYAEPPEIYLEGTKPKEKLLTPGQKTGIAVGVIMLGAIGLGVGIWLC